MSIANNATDKGKNFMITRRQILANTGQLCLLGAFTPTHLRAQITLMQRAIPKTGEYLPVIGLGTYRTFNVGDDPNELNPLQRVLELFFRHGGTVVDSSPAYGPSEAAFGYLAERINLPDDLFVATKVRAGSHAEGIRQMDASAQKMGVENIDLMQVHSLADWKTQLPILKERKAQGIYRYIGITASRVELYDDFITIMNNEPLDFIQINYSVAERQAEERILPLAMDRGIAVFVNRPFVAGALFSHVQSKALPDWATEFDCDSWGQFFLKFVLSHPAVTVALQATSNPQHLLDNLSAGQGLLPNTELRQRMVDLIGLTGRPPWT
ncbi:MAG: aldo/keto reductase [Rhodospirillaceae bacterium]|nr:aldo/keto reductase [Rhodospirillaceae bacterium]